MIGPSAKDSVSGTFVLIILAEANIFVSIWRHKLANPFARCQLVLLSYNKQQTCTIT